MIWKCLIFLSFITVSYTCKIVCYYSSWASYYPNGGKYTPENIDPHACTHIIYAFIGLKPNGDIRIVNPRLDLTDNGGLGALKRFAGLKKQNRDLKVMVSIGGWNEASINFSKVSASAALRDTFVKNIIQFLKKYGFDGLDVDWEYPATNGGKPEDYKNFISLLKALRSAFDPLKYILSVAVAPTESDIIVSYDVKEINKYVHFINLMAYDFHGVWDGVTGHNAPLNPTKTDRTAYQKQFNVKASVNIWLKKGASSEKLILGIPLQSRTFTLSNPNNHGIGAKIKGPGKPGPITQAAGILSYKETVPYLDDPLWKQQWDEDALALTIYKGDQFFSTENVTTMANKMDFATLKQLGGVMLWSIDQDYGYTTTFLAKIWCAFRAVRN